MARKIVIATFLFGLIFQNFTFAQTAEEYFNRGVAKRNLEDYRGAIQDFTKAIELNPNLCGCLLQSGTCKE